MHNIIKKFKKAPVISVLILNDIDISLKISQIIIQEGMTNLEIILRTKKALSTDLEFLHRDGFRRMFRR